MQTWALIVDSFRESLDRKIFWVMLLISLVVAAAMFCFSFEPNRINILFGTWTIESKIFTYGNALRTDFIASIIVEWITDIVLGSIGIFLALIATAGFFPAMMERGGIEVLLSKPMPRWKLVLGKYVGSLVFMAVQAAIFVTLTFLVAGFRWNIWLPRYFLVIPLMILMFSYLYSVSTLVAVYTRSTIAVILITLFAWIGFTGVQSTGDYFEMYPEWRDYRSAYKIVRIGRWIIPKTSDLALLARKWTKSADPMDLVPNPDADDLELMDRARRAEALRLKIHPAMSIGSSLLFEAAVLSIAMWRFSRKDF
jgi:ABC-type transport system involved in multi-copper enzyme maturation permease subunit